ncbi:MAG: hypothetical protein AVW06_03570 [Hadesarchaea archaeon DG-33-1]|nr:MAG: hypothetical protein AVW06_03570 [Hadesarchaea archaeon DG-33-1]
MISAFGFHAYVDTATAATKDEIENAIVLGLTWLADQQEPEGYFGSPEDLQIYKLAQTGLAVLKFEERAKELGYDPFDENYEYHEQVENGLDYLFSATSVNGDRVDILDSAYASTYPTSIAMMAIAASNNPDRTVGALGSPVDGWTYEEVLQGMMNWLIYAQQTDLNYPCDEGGWDYWSDPFDEYFWADQSNTGYATLALGYAAAPAPHGFGLTIPQEVLERLSAYIDRVQDNMDGDNWDGGSWYEPCEKRRWVNILKTGNLLYEMALVGDDLNSERVQNAISYIENHWNDAGPQPEYPKTSLGWVDSYQAMFTIMKGFEAFGINTIIVGGSDIDWFDQVSDVIVANQYENGYWEYLNTDITEGEESPVLRAAWAMLTLERVVPVVALPRIEIRKVDEENNLLGGATFKVEPNPYDGAELLVTDGDENDSNPTPGIILLENVPMDIYILRWWSSTPAPP